MPNSSIAAKAGKINTPCRDFKEEVFQLFTRATGRKPNDTDLSTYENMKRIYHITDKEALLALTYFIEIEKTKITSFGILPHIIKRALTYYENLEWKAAAIRKQFKKQNKKEKQTLTIKLNNQPKPSRPIMMVEEIADEEVVIMNDET